MSTKPASNRRILIVDDNEDIHHDFRRLLKPGQLKSTLADLDALEAELLGGAPAHPVAPSFELTSAFQGAEALEKVQRSLKDGAPYALAFIDVRMPPGWDGVETLARLWREDPNLLAVICSAYSDYSWEGISSRLGNTDRLLILKKPFDPAEVRQMAYTLVERWEQTAASQRTAQALRRSEATLRGLLRVLPEALLRVARDGTCLDFKAPGAGASAPHPAFTSGHNLGEALPADVARQLLTHLDQALGDGTTHVLEYEHRLGGEARCFQARIAATDTDEGLVLLRELNPGETR